MGIAGGVGAEVFDVWERNIILRKQEILRSFEMSSKAKAHWQVHGTHFV